MRNVLVIVFALAILALAGCRFINSTDSDLVGTWTWNDSPAFVYTFNSDGTGTRGKPDNTSTFTWSVSGRTLRIRCGAGIPMFGVRSERWSYGINGDALRLTSQQARDLVYNYTRN